MENIFDKHVFICTSGKKCPQKLNTDEIQKNLKLTTKELGINQKVRINKSGCLGLCSKGPVMVIYPQNKWYFNLDKSDFHEIFETEIIK